MTSITNPSTSLITPPAQNFEYASQFDLQQMTLILSSGTQQLDIRGMIVEWNIFEDIYNNCISGNATIYDTLNMLSNVGFSGNEQLHIVVDTPTKHAPIDLTFIIYNVSPISTDNKDQSKRGVSYTLNFCSPEKIKDQTIVVSKSYKSMLISDMVIDMMGPTYMGTNKTIYTESTSAPQDIIIPSMHPLKACKWLSTKALSSRQNPDYLFFENRYGYYFNTLETLSTVIPESPPSYIITPKGMEENSSVPDISRRMQAIKDYQFIGTPDTFEQTRNGVFGATLNTYDPIRMKFTSILYDILDGYSGFKSLGGGVVPYVPTALLSDTSQSRRYFYPTNYNRSQTQYGKQFYPNINNTLVEEFVAKRPSLLGGAETFKLRMILNGDVALAVGLVINVNYPSMDRREAVDINKMDPIYSGTYIITALRHSFGIKSHQTIIECIKGSTLQGMGRK